MHLSPETIDGLEFGWRLAANPRVAKRRLAFLEHQARFRQSTMGKTKAEMIVELKAHNPAYIVDILERHDIGMVRDRYVWTFSGRPAHAPSAGEEK